MAKNQKIVWYEGMFLDPHHFQQWERFLQYNLNYRINSLQKNNWGIIEIEVDTASLAGGSFNLVKCSGIMPDGLVFNIPDNDPAPNARVFTDLFLATMDKLTVFLTIPNEKNPGKNCQIDESHLPVETRFSIQNLEITDYNSGTNPKAIGVTKSNFQYRFNDESLEEMNIIKICEVQRASDGTFHINEDYIPPCLSISSSVKLMDYSNKILGAMVSKSEKLTRMVAQSRVDLKINDVKTLLYLQTLNTCIPLLNQYYGATNCHPEQIYSYFLMLAGQLSTIAEHVTVKPKDFPIYDHKNPTISFRQIFNQIMSLLDVETGEVSRIRSIALHRKNESLYEGVLSETDLAAQLFIGAKGNISENRIISELPNNIKIAAEQEIFQVLQAGIKGVVIEYLSRPPRDLIEYEQYYLFTIKKEGRFWDKISESMNMRLFVTEDFKSLELILLALLSPQKE